MSRNEPTTQQKLVMLRAARRELETSRGICAALNRAGTMYPSAGHLKAVKHLRRYVERSLQGYSFLESWLVHKGHVDVYTDMWSKAGRAKMLRTRQAWVDWMIACYEEDLAKQKGPKP
jgi:hypothetical protein